jgi:hypothetical protein
LHRDTTTDVEMATLIPEIMDTFRTYAERCWLRILRKFRGKFQEITFPNTIYIFTVVINFKEIVILMDKVEPDQRVQCSLKALKVLLETPQTTCTGYGTFKSVNMNSCSRNLVWERLSAWTWHDIYAAIYRLNGNVGRGVRLELTRNQWESYESYAQKNYVVINSYFKSLGASTHFHNLKEKYLPAALQ